MGRSIPAALFNSLLIIIIIPLLYWASIQSDYALQYTHSIIGLGQKLFSNETIQNSEYPHELFTKKYEETRGTQCLVKVSQLGYEYFHTPQLFYENWETLKPGQVLSLLSIVDPQSKKLQEIQRDYFTNKYGLTMRVAKQLCVIVTSFNNGENKLYQNNLKSIFRQNYNNYKVIYIDDASTDNNLNLVKNFVREHQLQSKFVFEKNDQNKGSLWNHHHYIHKHCNEKDVVVSIDGDDELVGSNVFSLVNEIYRNDTTWVSSSQTFAKKERNIWISHFPNEGLQKDEIRTYFYGHLKTFLAGLFMKIKKESFLNPETGQFFKIATDRALMYPLVEMSGKEHYLYLPEIFYFYNDLTINNNHKLRHEEQLKNEKIIKAMAPYEPINSPFN